MTVTVVQRPALATGGVPPSVSIQLNMEGTDGAQDATDASSHAHTLIWGGTAQVDTAFKKFETSSLLLDGNSDDLTVADHPSFAFGTAPYTIEGFIRFAALGSPTRAIFSKRNPSSGQTSFYSFYSGSTGRWRFFSSEDGTATTRLVNAFAVPAVGVWHHICFERNGSNKFRFYLNGVLKGSSTNTHDYFVGTAPLLIGNYSSSSTWLNGNVDEFRIYKGLAVYDNDGGFTPPTAPF